jgi:hypothetical protein
MYSDRPSAQKLLRELDEYLSGSITGKAIRLICTYVNTKHNIADIPSRTKTVSQNAEEITYGDRSDWIGETDAKDRQEQTAVLLQMLFAQVSKEGKKLDLVKLGGLEEFGDLPNRRQRNEEKPVEGKKE